MDLDSVEILENILGKNGTLMVILHDDVFKKVLQYI